MIQTGLLHRLAIFIPLLICTLISGCSTTETDDSIRQHSEGSYCINGGRSNNYSCDKATASQAIPMHPRTVDEEWMYETLEELKEWLNDEKARRDRSPSSP